LETQQQTQSRIYADINLIEKVKKKYPETGRMTYTGIVHWALIKMLEKRGEA